VTGQPKRARVIAPIQEADRTRCPSRATPGLQPYAPDQPLHDVMGLVRPDPWDSSGAMGAAAMELMWRLAELAPRVVLESNFRHASPQERARIAALVDTPVEVYCRVPPEVAAARFAARNSGPGKHPVHVASSMPLEWFDQFQEPVGLGPVLEVDTTVPVDIPAVARWVSRALR